MQPLHLLLALLVVVVWGFNFVVIKIGLEEIPPLLLAFARFFLTSIPAVFFIKRPTAPFKMVVYYGLIMFSLQFSLLFTGIYAGVPPGLASLLLQFQVFFTVFLAMIFLGERLRSWQIAGALVSFLGIVLVAMNLDSNFVFSGFVLVIAAAASWGSGNLISKKIGKVNMISLVVWGSLIAWPPLLLLSLFTEGYDQILDTIQHLNWLSSGAVLYITYLATFFCFCAWNWLLHHYPVGIIAPFTLLVPVGGILSSVLVLDEPLQSWKISAALLVIGGVCVNLLGSRIAMRRAKNKINPV